MARFDGMMLWTDDFLADTTALDKGEVGSYLLLLLAAWRTKTGTLPDDDKMLARMARCSPHEWKRMRPLMLRFFEVVNQEWQQPRLLREREAVERRSISAKGSASRGWVNRKNSEASGMGKSLENHKSDDAIALRSGSDRNAPVSVSVLGEEESKKESETVPSRLVLVAANGEEPPDLPEAAKGIWNDTAGARRRIRVLSQDRRETLRNRLRDHFGNNLDEWRKFCRTIARAKWLNGGSDGSWHANFEFCLKEKNLNAILEGFYQPAPGEREAVLKGGLG